MHAHARHDGHAHAHLHEPLDALDGGHFDGHVESGAVSRKQLDDSAAKRRFDAVRNKGFFAKLRDVHFALFRQDMLGIHYQGQLVLADFRGQKLRVPRDKRDRSQIQPVVQDFMRDVPGEHAVYTHLNAGMPFTKLGQCGEQGVNRALVDAQREFAALQSLQFGETLLDFIAQVDQAFCVVFQKCARISETDGPRPSDEERLSERVLQLADRQADGRLGAIKALRGAGKTAFFCHHQEYLQFAEIQANPPVAASIRRNYQK